MNRLNKLMSHLSSNDCSNKRTYGRRAELTIWDVSNPDVILYKDTILDTNEIKSILKRKGVGFDVWPLKKVNGNESNDEILKMYHSEINDILKNENLKIYDIVNVTETNQVEIRNNFLEEHIHPTE
eukprot:325273_1